METEKLRLSRSKVDKPGWWWVMHTCNDVYKLETPVKEEQVKELRAEAGADDSDDDAPSFSALAAAAAKTEPCGFTSDITSSQKKSPVFPRFFKNPPEGFQKPPEGF